MPQPPNIPPSSSRSPKDLQPSVGFGERNDDSGVDALPPEPPPGGPDPPPATLAFPETQFGGHGESAPQQIPGYEILGELGRGGMGVVYKARQLRLGRLVAIKMSRSGEMSSEDVARFRAEAEAVARLRHPNIVQIYEIGEHEGRPFFCIEYVEGGSLADFLKGTPQPPRASAELVETLARAMETAHQQGIIHRDLKPANVLLAGSMHPSNETDTLPVASTRTPQAGPKITDFGVAKRLDKQSLHTATGAVLGTPNYMAPEQAWGSNKRRPIGPGADVYALGAILYEMLTGRPPFVGETPLDTLQQVVMQEPVPPTRLQPKVPKDLETVCLKCLQKEPGRRYQNAVGLAEDLGRFLHDLPIRAKAEGPWTRILRWRRRNPAVAVLLLMVLVVLAAGTAVSTYFAFTAQFEADRAVASAGQAEANEQTAAAMARTAKQNEETAEVNLKKAQENARERDKLLRVVYGWYISLANTALLEKNVGQVFNALDSLVPEKAESEDLRGFEWYYMRRRCGGRPIVLEQAHVSAVRALAFSPNGALLATANRSKNSQGQAVPVEVFLWHTQSSTREWRLKGHTDTINCLTFHPDGRRLASGSDDGTVMVWNYGVDSSPITTCRGHDAAVTCVQFTPDGRHIVSSSLDKTVRFWNAETGEQAGSLTNLPDEAAEWLAIHPTGGTIAVALRNGTVVLCETASSREINRLEGQGSRVTHLAWHPRGKQLALASADGKVRLWDVGVNALLATAHNPAGKVNQVAFSPDGNHLASASADGKVRLFGGANVTQLKSFGEHRAETDCLAFGAEGSFLASGAVDGTVVIRPLDIKPAALAMKGHSAGLQDVCWNADGAMLATSRGVKSGPDDPAEGSEVIIWNLVANQPRLTLTGHAKRVFHLAFQPKPAGKDKGGGKPISGATELLATTSLDGTVRLWSAETGDEIRQLSRQEQPFYGLAWSPDGKRLAATGDSFEGGQAMTRVTIWDVVTGNQLQTFLAPQDWMESLAWSYDGKWLAGGSSLSDGVRLWDAETGALVHVFKGHSGAINGLTFSLDGRWLASASADKSVRIWDMAEKKEKQILSGHRGEVRAVAFHPDGKRIASGGDDEMVQLWDLETGKEVYTLAGHTGAVTALAFRPDGFQLATASRDGMVRIWDATPAPEDSRLEKLPPKES